MLQPNRAPAKKRLTARAGHILSEIFRSRFLISHTILTKVIHVSHKIITESLHKHYHLITLRSDGGFNSEFFARLFNNSIILIKRQFLEGRDGKN